MASMTKTQSLNWDASLTKILAIVGEMNDDELALNALAAAMCNIVARNNLPHMAAMSALHFGLTGEY